MSYIKGSITNKTFFPLFHNCFSYKSINKLEKLAWVNFGSIYESRAK